MQSVKWSCVRRAVGMMGALAFVWMSGSFGFAADSVLGERLVKWAPGSEKKSLEIQKELKSLGVQNVQSFSLLKNWSKWKGSEKALKAGVDRLQAKGLIIRSEPNWIVQLTEMSTDERFSEQWALQNQGQGGGKPGADISALPAWARGNSGREVVVAVIDTGVDYRHSDLRDQMWVNRGEVPGDGLDNDNNGYIDDVYGWNVYKGNGNPLDDHNHGTHCAGVIAAAHNGKGVMGVAPQARIMAVKFLGSAGNGTLEGGILATEYAIKNGAQILSNSWGGDGYSEAMKEVIEVAHAKGILYVAAAGNEHSNNDASRVYPASYEVPNVVSVAATDHLDELTIFSNWGARSVHLAAPGLKILSTIRDESFKAVSGTSMACPHVAGAAAQLMDLDPSIDVVELKNRLIRTVDPLLNLRGLMVSSGRLNLLNALLDRQTPPPVDTHPWIEVPYSIESQHPYSPLINQTWKIRHPGAKEFRIHFEQFHMQYRVDYLAIRNEQGKVIETFSGNQGSLWSRPIPGEVATIEIRSDSEEEYYGFKIDKIGVRY